MKVERIGFERKCHWTTLIEDCEPEIRWLGCSTTVILRVENVPDLYQASVSHNYKVSMKLKDIASVLSTLSNEAIPDAAREIHEALKEKSQELVRLLTCASGCVPQPLPAGQKGALVQA